MTTKVPPMIMPVTVKFWGDRAMFTRPEFSAERVSYLVPTPSAIRGLLEAIYWKPEFRWKVREIHVLNPIQHFSETRNEVSAKAGRGALTAPYVVDGKANDRLQRHSYGLADVAYAIVAEPVPVPFTVEDMEKHVHIFTRRVETGQCFTTPYLGCREWSASFSPVDWARDKAIPVTMDLGVMAFDQNYVRKGMRAEHFNDTKPIPVWYRPRLEAGVVRVPDELYDVCGGSVGHDRDQPPPPDYAV